MSMQSTTVADLSADELRQTIDDRQFQLSTLDFRTPDFARVKENLRADVKAMEARLKEKESEAGFDTLERDRQTTNEFSTSWGSRTLPRIAVRDHQMQRPSTSQSSSGYGSGFGAYAQQYQNGFGGHFASDGPMLGQHQTTGKPTWSFEHLRHTPSTPAADYHPGFGSASTSESSPEHMLSDSTPPLPTLSSNGQAKRQRHSLTLPPLGTHRGAKSMRTGCTTPSPVPTGTATPSSEDSFDFDDPGIYQLLGSSREDMRRMREDQKAFEREKREKQEQERQDAELARSLHEEYQRALRTTPTAESSTRSTWHHDVLPSSSPAQLDWSTNFRTPARPIPADPTSGGHRYNRLCQPKQGSVKQEQAYSLSAHETSLPQSSSIIDLGSDDVFDDTAGHFGSDLVEIDPSSFVPSGRESKADLASPFGHETGQSRALIRRGSWNLLDSEIPNEWQGSQVGSYNTSIPYYDLTGPDNTGPYNMNSAQSMPNSDIWTTTYNEVRQGLMNVAGGVKSAVSHLLDGEPNSYSSASNNFSSSDYAGADPAGIPQHPSLLGFSPAQGMYNESRRQTVQQLMRENPYDPANPIGDYQRYIETLGRLSADPHRSVSDIKSLLENIRPDEDLDRRTLLGNPESMSQDATLYDHQKLGLEWMIKMEEGSNKGGILADDMGLGKTIQAIALMVKRRSTDQSRKTTLIIAPVALLRQWESEIALKLRPDPQHRLTTYIHHGAKGTRVAWETLKRYDVVLTTYGTIAAEYGRKLIIDIQKRQNPNWRPMSNTDRLSLLGDECKWYRIILDEAQSIKNKATKSAKAVYELQALTRFAMSGTPMMNNVGELFSLIHFLRIKPYCVQEKFNIDFKRPLAGSSATAKEGAMRKLQALLKAVLLRRTKKSLIDGKPILSLPERTTEVQHAVFSPDEQSFYESLQRQSQIRFNRYLRAGTIGRNYSNVLVLLLRLRQACCHPHLINDIGIASGVAGDVSAKEMINLAEGLAADVVNRIKEAGAIECPICMDLAENATIFTPCGHSTCSECFTRIQDPTQAMADDEGGEGRVIKCPNCRGKVDPKKVTDYNSFKKVHLPKSSEDESSDSLELEANDESGSEEDDEEDSDDDPTLNGFVVDDEDDDDDDESKTDDDELGEEGYGKGKSPFDKAKVQKKKKKDFKGKGKAKGPKRPRKTLAQLKVEGRKNTAAHKKYLKRLDEEWVSSSKIDKTIEILQAVNDRKEGEKTIIFSQFTSLLDLLEVPINRNNWSYRRYDGSMSAGLRNDAVLDFNSKPDCRIILVSLKAGNAGLNLTAASQVIILDPFWNPYIEEQAIDRAHRIGQRRPVQVHRILIPNTVEDRIIALQDTKRAVIEGALDENASASIGRLGTRELAFLFVSYTLFLSACWVG
ncbi:hypothetical protein MMC26_000275 [Xylographa opegraphella]|nr:hypothetical protein [Xylographa opegraphella]